MITKTFSMKLLISLSILTSVINSYGMDQADKAIVTKIIKKNFEIMEKSLEEEPRASLLLDELNRQRDAFFNELPINPERTVTNFMSPFNTTPPTPDIPKIRVLHNFLYTSVKLLVCWSTQSKKKFRL